MLTINPMAAGDVASNYNVVISGDCAASVTSTNAALLLCPTGLTNRSTNNTNQVALMPNPFSNSLVLVVKDLIHVSNCSLIIYNALGTEVLSIAIDAETTSVSTSELPSGLYFYKVLGNNKTIRSGKIISQQ
jgi:hypothetical protein